MLRIGPIKSSLTSISPLKAEKSEKDSMSMKSKSETIFFDQFFSLKFLGIMFDDAGDIVPVLVGPEAARIGGDPHYHTFDGNTVHYQGLNNNKMT